MHMTGVMLIFMTPVIFARYHRDYKRIRFALILNIVSKDWSPERNEPCESTLAESSS
jgi:hypothetical protein